MADENHSFHWADYLVFGVSLALSIGIGIFFAFYGKRQSDTKEYLLGGRNMNPIAVGFSILASILNAVFLIGVPSEIYYFGTIYLLIMVALTIVITIAALVFVPFYRRSQYISCYEYLGVRFNSIAVRMCAAAVFAASIILFLGVVLYAPALAFEAVTGLRIHITLILTGAVCTIYVVLGGMKAVVWTDAIQVCIIIIGTLTIAVKGASEVGGGSEVWQIAKDANRINFDITSADPTVRHTIWTQVIGQVFIWIPLFGSNQMCIQRYFAVSSTLKAQISLYIALFTTIIITMLVSLCALVMYAYFKDCDPLISNRVEKGDQLFPLLLMDLLGEFHGLPGLFVAAVFAAALSSVSSAVNSLAAVILEDFIKPVYELSQSKKLDEKRATWISKGLSLFLGFFTIALSYIVPYMGDELIQLPTTIWGVVGAPLFGVFVLAMFFPCANASGALAGLFVSLAFNLWLAIGGILYGRKPQPIMPLGLCRSQADDVSYMNGTTMVNDVSTFYLNTTLAPAQPVPTTEKPHGLEDFYSVSYAWYGLIGTVSCVLIGLLVSWSVDGIYYGCTAKGSKLKGSEVYDCGQCCFCLPHSMLRWVRCNIEHDDSQDHDYPIKHMPNNGNVETAGYLATDADNPTFQPDYHHDDDLRL